VADVVSSQGSSASFAGTPLGKVTGIGQKFATAGGVDFTNTASIVIGSGANTRVIRRSEPAMVEAGEVSVKILGLPPFSRADIGLIGTLSITVGGVNLAKTAYLADVDSQGAVGQLVESTLVFNLTGLN
jgi:hypothetical protein